MALVRLTASFALAAALAACSGDDDDDDVGPGPGDAGPDDAAPDDDAGAGELPDPAEPGPHDVGVVTIELTDDTRARALPIEIWYPADLAAGAGTPNVYDLGESLGEIETAAHRGAAPSEGVFPLMLFSHGFGGIRFQSFFLTEHLASHGWVVAAPDHVGNTIFDLGKLSDEEAIAQSALDRPLDMAFLTDRMLAGDTGLAVEIDPAHVATSGHSFGGWTCLETARQDERVAAAFALGPGFRAPSTPALVGEIGRPVAIFGGSADHTTPFDTDQQPAYEAAEPPKLLVEIMGAGHLDFSDLCSVPELIGIFDDGCDPELLDPAIVRAVVATVSVPWLGRHVLGDARWDPYLEDSAIRALGPVEVWSE